MGRAVAGDDDAGYGMASTHHDEQDVQVHAVVAAEQSLIVEAVCTALGSSGLESDREPWPGVLPSPRGHHAEARHTAGLLVCDLKDWRQIRASGLVLRRRSIPWAVLTSAVPGPAWGAVYDHGARVVLSAQTPLDQVVRTLTTLALNPTASELDEDPEQRQRFQTQWRHLCERRAELSSRARALTPREREVLMLLYEGAMITEIAALLQVSPSTVRSQVKAVRQKLGVTSQLAAVAAYGSLIEPDLGRALVTS